MLVRWLPSINPDFEAALDLNQVLELPDGSRVWLESKADGLLDAGCLDEAGLSVAYRKAGARLRLPMRAGSTSVNRLLQSAGVPVWLRSRIPILYQGERLVAVGERWIDRRFMSRPGQPAVSFRWQSECLFDTLLARIQSGRSDTGRTT
jgi:tRNA(Ile)-lysidine synthase